MPKKTNRREFMRLAGMGFMAATLPILGGATDRRFESKKKNGNRRFELGMASYTFREFSLDKTLAMTKRLGLKKIAFKSFHLPLESSESEIKAVVKKVEAAGLVLYGCGVVYMKNKEEADRAFRYAQAGGMGVIIGVPNHELLEYTNKKVREYDIKLAIHNHGPGDKLYPTPQSAYERIKDLDPRMGLCLDIGHTQRSGIDPSEAAEKVADRILDIHIKDVTAASAEGGPIEIGRGVIDIPRFLRTILKIDYRGIVSFEYEKDPKDPLPGVAESLGYIKGLLSQISG
jgi:sugar phosphate isomerase/epimerase